LAGAAAGRAVFRGCGWCARVAHLPKHSPYSIHIDEFTVELDAGALGREVDRGTQDTGDALEAALDPPSSVLGANRANRKHGMSVLPRHLSSSHGRHLLELTEGKQVGIEMEA